VSDFELKRIADGLNDIAAALEHVATALGYQPALKSCTCGAGKALHSARLCKAAMEFAKVHGIDSGKVDLTCTRWDPTL
jgi:hypothetical protein